MDERYPVGSTHPSIDQELWEMASVVKKNYVKGQGYRPRSSGIGSCIYGGRSTQSSYQATTHNAADCVERIYKDPTLLRTLFDHLKALCENDTAAARRQDGEESRRQKGEDEDLDDGEERLDRDG